ncbi:hypothetical protein HYQ19_gp054 [Arthrobacter phage DrYang]|uniref:Uncharacterized protein n=1 Tax=Arthrobacter phage DrYang TaxID=2686080 RepID=A0A6B9JBZ1_9CAUD|nr:hypothetical protein HYQ19_gp054 [Arthrobacter phage DrYang]QGZ17153.1 hypothetical protein SEA_DRYANG_54 [Arthrobacter phage DrYang]
MSHSHDTPTPAQSTAGENPVENPVNDFLRGLAAGAVTPVEALTMTTELLTGLTELVPEDARERLTRLSEAITGKGDTDASRFREIATQRLDASRWMEQGQRAEAKAAAIEAMTPEEWALSVTLREAEQAKKSAERQEARDGAIWVDITTEVTDTVRVTKEEMTAAGWHHESECNLGFTDAMDPGEVAVLATVTHHALQDYHDTAHRVTSWANCPHEPCRSLPELAKVYRAGGAHA